MYFFPVARAHGGGAWGNKKWHVVERMLILRAVQPVRVSQWGFCEAESLYGLFPAPAALEWITGRVGPRKAMICNECDGQ